VLVHPPRAQPSLPLTPAPTDLETATRLWMEARERLEARRERYERLKAVLDDPLALPSALRAANRDIRDASADMAAAEMDVQQARSVYEGAVKLDRLRQAALIAPRLADPLKRMHEHLDRAAEVRREEVRREVAAVLDEMRPLDQVGVADLTQITWPELTSHTNERGHAVASLLDERRAQLEKRGLLEVRQESEDR
jgi:hypothetical protein